MLTLEIVPTSNKSLLSSSFIILQHKYLIRRDACFSSCTINSLCSLRESFNVSAISSLSDDYLAEQKEIQPTFPLKESKLEKLKDSVANVNAFIEEAKEITEINELTATILHRFIDRIVVGERTEKYSRTALQEIQIHYRYIGLLDDVIEDTATNEQQEVAQKQQKADSENSLSAQYCTVQPQFRKMSLWDYG